MPRRREEPRMLDTGLVALTMRAEQRGRTGYPWLLRRARRPGWWGWALAALIVVAGVWVLR
jgi:hypothetical protein